MVAAVFKEPGVPLFLSAAVPAFAEDPCDCCGPTLPCAERICISGFPSTRDVAVGGFTFPYDKFNGLHTLEHVANQCILRKSFDPPNPTPYADRVWLLELAMKESFSGEFFTMVGTLTPTGTIQDPIFPIWTHHPGVLGQIPQNCHSITADLPNLMQLVGQPDATYEVI